MLDFIFDFSIRIAYPGREGQLMGNWKWRLAGPTDDVVKECEAGFLCAYPQKKKKPGNSYGYWSSGSIELRTCSRKCAEIVMEKTITIPLPGGKPFRK